MKALMVFCLQVRHAPVSSGGRWLASLVVNLGEEGDFAQHAASELVFNPAACTSLPLARLPVGTSMAAFVQAHEPSPRGVASHHCHDRAHCARVGESGVPDQYLSKR